MAQKAGVQIAGLFRDLRCRRRHRRFDEKRADVGVGIVDGVVDGVRQPGDALFDLLARQCRVTEHQSALRKRRGARHIGAAGGERIDADARPACQAFDNDGVRNARRQIPNEVQAAGFAGHADIAEVAAQCDQQVVAVFAVKDTATLQMRRVGARPHHFRERRLFEPGIAIVQKSFCRGDDTGEMLGHDHITEAKPGAERARKRAKIDRAIGRARRNCLQRRALVAQIAVPIVFEHVATIAPRPGNNSIAAIERERVTDRKLMRRRNVKECRRPARQLFRNQAFEIDGDAGDFGAGRFERERRALITGILDRARRAVIEK